MRHYMHRAASVAIGTLAALGLASCGATDVASTGDDRVIPAVSLSLESAYGPPGFDSCLGAPATFRPRPGHRQLRAVRVQSRASLPIRLLINVDSVALNGATEIDNVFDVSLAGVRSGQRVTVQTTVYDGAGNMSVAQAGATAFDPNVPRAVVLNPILSVFPGGVYGVSVIAVDSTGVTKIGFETSGAVGFAPTARDSASRCPCRHRQLPVQHPAERDARIHVPDHAVRREQEGLRGGGAVITVRIVAAGTDETVTAGLPDGGAAPGDAGLHRYPGTRRGWSRAHRRVPGARTRPGTSSIALPTRCPTPIQQVTRKKMFNVPDDATAARRCTSPPTRPTLLATPATRCPAVPACR